MKRVAVIDDSVIVLESVKNELCGAGFEVIALTQPSRQNLLSEQGLDLILLDINMPQAFGDDIARFLKEEWGVAAPIYLYSGLHEDELKQRTKDAHADGYICKDWGMERLISQVKIILGVANGASALCASAPAEENALPNAPQELDADAAPTDPPPTEAPARGIYFRFASRCQERCEKILALVDGFEDSEAGQRSFLADVGLEIHDWLGEAKLLELYKLTAVISLLQDIVLSWGDTFRSATQGAQLHSWIKRLTELSRHYSLEAPDSQTAQDLRRLKSELSEELSNTKTKKEDQTGEFAILEDARRRILIFDDSPIIGEILLLELESRNHRVALAATLAEFEHHLATFNPEVIFLDINMPEIKGDEMCRQLRRRFPENRVPIILLSSIPVDELAIIAREAGADGILSKQRGMDEIIRYLDWLLEEILNRG